MIFVVSSFVVAFVVDGDSNHAKAVELMDAVAREVYGPAVISDYVFDEVVTVTLVRSKSLPKARLVGEAMLKSFRMLRVEEAVFRGAWRRFRNQRGTRFSFMDATTVELMRQNRVGSIATFDRDFFGSDDFAVLGP